MLDPQNLPFAYEIDTATATVYVSIGPWTPAAVSAWVARLLADPDYRAGMRSLLDLRFAAGPLPDVPTLHAIADALTPMTSLPIPTRWAVVVASRPAYDRVRLLETLTSGGSVILRAFDNRDDAIRWLALHQQPI